MKLKQKNLIHKMINESPKFQGCSSMHMGITKDLDIPGLSVTVGTLTHSIAIMSSYVLGFQHVM